MEMYTILALLMSSLKIGLRTEPWMLHMPSHNERRENGKEGKETREIILAR